MTTVQAATPSSRHIFFFAVIPFQCDGGCVVFVHVERLSDTVQVLRSMNCEPVTEISAMILQLVLASNPLVSNPLE